MEKFGVTDTGQEGIVAGNIVDMPYESESFDVIVSRGVFDLSTYEEQTMAVVEDMMKAIERVLRPGGYYYVNEFAYFAYPYQLEQRTSFQKIEEIYSRCNLFQK